MTKKGFSLLESALVLAIAGLIFLMVFVALPTLQRNQRDTQRKRDLALIAAELDTYHAGNKVIVVSNSFSKWNNKRDGFCTFYNNHIDKDLRDPSTGEPYKVGLWGTTKVINCLRGSEGIEDRGEFDMAVWVHENQNNDSWPKMEIGDFQYDEGGYCDGEIFLDDVGHGKSYGFKAFALRTKLENGSYFCVDNGGQAYINSS